MDKAINRESKQEITAAMEGTEAHAADLMLAALSLSEMIASGTTEIEPNTGGKILRIPLADATNYVMQLQATAKTAADDLLFIKSEVGYYLREEK